MAKLQVYSGRLMISINIHIKVSRPVITVIMRTIIGNDLQGAGGCETCALRLEPER
jgi:hypothetical protein